MGQATVEPAVYKHTLLDHDRDLLHYSTYIGTLMRTNSLLLQKVKDTIAKGIKTVEP